MGRKAAHLALDELGADSTRPVLVGTYRDPVWPHGIVGSITHTSDLAAALVAWADRTDGVGIDAEHIRHAPELEAHVPIVEERRWLDETEPSVRARELIALFSAKEAVFKAFYPRVGRFFGFDAASLRPARGGFRARLIDESLDVEYPPTRIFRVGSTWFGDTVLSWLLLPAPGR
jgi:enterobactin synthetase component D